MTGTRLSNVVRCMAMLALAGCGATASGDSDANSAASTRKDEAAKHAGDVAAKQTGNSGGAAANSDDEASDEPADEPAGGQEPRESMNPPVASHDVDSADVLFVIDNSGSMSQEQAALAAQLPRLIEALTATGIGGPEFESLHLGVVSTDMGLVGISDIDQCEGLGDDGILRNSASSTAMGCDQMYPTYLEYAAGEDAPQSVAADLACMTSLGTEGCGFEQPLEAALKAVWPGADDRITFLGDVNGFGTEGNGDGANLGFLRGGVDGDSALVVVLVSDEEDCSSSNTIHFTPNTYLDPNNPSDRKLMNEGLNVRCNENPGNLYQTSRYVAGLRALRPGREDLVMFAALVGVPPETVNASVLDHTDFADEASRASFYEAILDHPQMQPTIESNGTPDPADDTMTPSCNTSAGLAYPPRRIVDVAKGFGPNGLVQSICEQDFAPAMDALARHIGRVWPAD